jgi:hypothetical protein
MTSEGGVIGASGGAAGSRLPDAGEMSDVDDAEDDENGPDIGEEPESFDAPASPIETARLESEAGVSDLEMAVAQEPPADSTPVISAPAGPAPARPEPAPSAEASAAADTPADDPDRPRSTEPFGD